MFVEGIWWSNYTRLIDAPHAQPPEKVPEAAEQTDAPHAQPPEWAPEAAAEMETFPDSSKQLQKQHA